MKNGYCLHAMNVRGVCHFRLTSEKDTYALDIPLDDALILEQIPLHTSVYLTKGHIHHIPKKYREADARRVGVVTRFRVNKTTHELEFTGRIFSWETEWWESHAHGHHSPVTFHYVSLTHYINKEYPRIIPVEIAVVEYPRRACCFVTKDTDFDVARETVHKLNEVAWFGPSKH